MSEKQFSLGGKVLRIDLTSGEVWTEPTRKYTQRFLGGRGIDNWILYNEVKPWVTPFDPANRLIFGAGVLVGTLAPCATRHSIDAKSPMAGGVGSANSCGHFAPELKFAGYDHIVFQGRSRRPAYLWIDDDQVKILDASHIWGKTTWDTDDLIKEQLGDDEVQIACIGPAGENLVRSACVITNRARSASRCGLGAVMGSKNLKAVVVRGSGSIEVAYPERFMEAVDRAWEKLKASRAANKELNPHRFNEANQMPVRNFQDAYMSPDKLDKLTPQVYEENCEIRRLGYFACPIYCSRFYKVKSGQYVGLASEGLHANDLLNWVGRFDLDLDDPAVMIKLHALCNEYGLDQDNASC